MEAEYPIRIIKIYGRHFKGERQNTTNESVMQSSRLLKTSNIRLQKMRYAHENSSLQQIEALWIVFNHKRTTKNMPTWLAKRVEKSVVVRCFVENVQFCFYDDYFEHWETLRN
ncbi:hypothetical protein NQ318_014630 [Aromia moschata]|uniref:Uncharacterized protein n=1 Tax=Aromia moschata TaxID=1265417 RepID=A0AAV8ZAT4_9CUCU|nr:hypothetical protein NQ318_014630 [Aromia moschata]